VSCFNLLAFIFIILHFGWFPLSGLLAVVRSSDLRYTGHWTLWRAGLVIQWALQALVGLLEARWGVWTNGKARDSS